jgi:hypothetical protein
MAAPSYAETALQIVGQRPNTKATEVYKNTIYGFTFDLPISWKGYSVIVEYKQGEINSDKQETTKIEKTYPQITIRHPMWTKADSRQDIPIMVFTHSQWRLVEQGELITSAAPIGPAMLGQNSKYVFALPPRYNYAFPTGFEEVNEIIRSRPLHSMSPGDF